MSGDKYTHSKVEDKIYSYWEKNNLFKPKSNKKKIFNSNTTAKYNRQFTHGSCFK